MGKVKFLKRYKDFKIGDTGEFEGEELKFIIERKIGNSSNEIIKNSKDENLKAKYEKEINELNVQNNELKTQIEDLKVQILNKDDEFLRSKEELKTAKKEIEKLSKK